jgi:hypothetical protein
MWPAASVLKELTPAIQAGIESLVKSLPNDLDHDLPLQVGVGIVLARYVLPIPFPPANGSTPTW